MHYERDKPAGTEGIKGATFPERGGCHFHLDKLKIVEEEFTI